MTTIPSKTTPHPAYQGRWRQVTPTGQQAPRTIKRIENSQPEPCLDLVRLMEKVSGLEEWRLSTETDLKAIREVISQVKLLMALSIGGGGLSILALTATIVSLVTGGN